MIVIEYMENGSLDAFLRVSVTLGAREASSSIFSNFSSPFAGKCLRASAADFVWCINIINLVPTLQQRCDLHFHHGQWKWLTRLCFTVPCRNTTANSQSSSWWECCGASRREWDTSLIWDTSIEIWLHGTSLSTAISYVKCPTSACRGWSTTIPRLSTQQPWVN